VDVQNIDAHRVKVPALFKRHDHLVRLRPVMPPSLDVVEAQPNKPRLLQRLVVRSLDLFAPHIRMQERPDQQNPEACDCSKTLRGEH
jgi:hypothetical protein